MLMPKEEMVNSYRSQSSTAEMLPWELCIWMCRKRWYMYVCLSNIYYYKGHSPDWAPWTRWISDNTALLCAIGFVVFFNFKDNIR